MPLITAPIVAVGDSMTLGVNATTDYPTIAAGHLGVGVHNLGLSGSGWGTNSGGTTGGNTLTVLAASQVDTPYVGNSPQPFLTLMAGGNDIYFGFYTAAQTVTLFQTYVQARLTAGWTRSHIIVLTMMSRTGVLEADRVTYNTGMVSSQGTYGYNLARLDLDPNIGGANAYQNTTYFGDGTHPTDAGQSIIAGIIEALQAQAFAAPLRLRLHA